MMLCKVYIYMWGQSMRTIDFHLTWKRCTKYKTLLSWKRDKWHFPLEGSRKLWTMFLVPLRPGLPSMGPDVSEWERLLRLNWCDSDWWRYQLMKPMGQSKAIMAMPSCLWKCFNMIVVLLKSDPWHSTPQNFKNHVQSSSFTALVGILHCVGLIILLS